MFPIIPSDSIIAVFEIRESGNTKVGWLMVDGTRGQDKAAAVRFYGPDAAAANAKFYSNLDNAGQFTWPVKPS